MIIIMKAVDFRKGNTHSLASMIVLKADISVAKNVTTKIIANINVIPNQMSVGLQQNVKEMMTYQ